MESESNFPLASKEGNLNLIKTILGIGIIAVGAHILISQLAKL